MITKMTETNILCGDISIPNWRRQFSIEIIPKMTETYIPFGDIQIPIDRTLHLLLGHSNSNWKNSSVSKWFQTWQKLTSDSVWRLSNSNWKMQFSIELISKITELYILCGSIRILNEKDSLVLKSFQRWQNLTFFVGTFKFRLTEPHIFCWDIQVQLKKTVQYWNDFKDDGPEHPLWWHSNPTEKDNSISKRFERSQNFTSFVGPFKTQLEKTVHYRIDYKDDRTLHCLRGHSTSNWKRQFSIEMITKMTEHYIVCGDIQIPTEKSSSVSKWFQRSQNFTSTVGTFKFQQKKSSLVLKWFQRWQNHAFFVETFKFQLKNHFSIEMISRIKELYILCWDIQIPTEKHRLLFKWLQRWQTLTFFVGAFKFQLKEAYIISWDIQIPTGKKQFIIQMTSKMTEPYIVWGTLKFQLKKQFSIEMISKMTDPTILCRDIQNPTEKDNSVSKRFERSQNFTSFVGTFKSQLKKTVHYRNDYKDDRTLHSLWGHSNSNWKRQLSI